MTSRGLTRAAQTVFVSLGIALGASFVAEAAPAQPIPNAMESSAIKITQFDNPADPEDIPGWFGNRLFLSGDATTALIGSDSLLSYCSDSAYTYERVNGEWMTSPSHVFTNPDARKYTCTFFAAALSAAVRRRHLPPLFGCPKR